MVEGGGCIITEFLEGIHHDHHNVVQNNSENQKEIEEEIQQSLLDYLCITISPKVIGNQQGYGYGYGDEYCSYESFKKGSLLSLSSLSLFSLVSSLSSDSTPVTMMYDNENDSDNGRTTTTPTTWPRRKSPRHQRQQGGGRRPPQLPFQIPVRYTTLGGNCVLYSKILRKNEKDDVDLKSIDFSGRICSLVVGILEACIWFL
mmetsp:Transcript_45965/g.51406  ORF Transcript_45965/g.51406 Transcript_45965/m.51406 type:complete len:202 (-) Transcript_45965:98-703(-)